MDFELSESQAMLRESVRRFLAERAPLDGYVRARIGAPGDARIRASGDPCDAVWRDLASLGLAGLLVPEALGGGGLGMIEMGVACEELGRAAFPGSFLPTAVGAVTVLRSAGGGGADDALRAIAAGERLGAVALWEPARGYDWRTSDVAARRDGEGWRLTGTKAPVPGGLHADLVWVTARAGSDLGIFLLRGREGVRATSLESVDPTQPLARLDLADAPAERVGPPDAVPLLASLVDRLAAGAVADGLGAAGRAFELATAWAHERRQFGRPIGSFQAVQHLLVDMLQDLELARAATYYALWALDEADPAEAHRAVTMAKAFASRALPELGAQAIQVLGGIGYTWEHDVHLFYKRLLTMQHLYGDEGVHLDELARLVLDAPR